jgi:lipid-A-disaccharide synthase
MKNILIIAAENSAENYGIQIIDEFQKRSPGVNFFGVGGDKFLARGVDVIVHNRELSIVGIIEVISSLIKLKRYMTRLIKAVIQRKAVAVLLIDYPDFNIRLAKKIKSIGIPVYYYISPTIWAWRYSRVKLLKKYVHHMFIIFPFEIPIFEKENIPFSYTGHPLMSIVKVDESKKNFKNRKKINDSNLVISLLPGSRKSEVVSLLPRMLKAMAFLAKEFPITLFLLKAVNIDKELIAEFIKDSPVKIELIEQKEGYNLINASDAILTTCGTSNLEIAILGVPFVAVYRVNSLSYLLGKKFVKINLYSIVNILSGKEVIRELIQHTYKVQNIIQEMRRIISDQEVRKTMLKEFQDLQTKLTKGKNPQEIIYQKIKEDIL